jgi:putative photosynthetic complex assembly protein 2
VRQPLTDPVVLLAVVAAVGAAWWASTVAIMRVAGGGLTVRRVVVGGIPALVASCALAVFSAPRVDAPGDVAGFIAALLAWGFVELTLLTGVVVGRRRTPCPPLRGARRFVVATEAVWHHELLLVAVGALVVACAHGDNNTAALTYGTLWVLRLSAKLNLFIGVPHAHAHLLPQRVSYLASYFGPGRHSSALWASIALGCAALVFGLVWALGRGVRVADALVLSLGALGVLEHIFMAINVGDDRLWTWARVVDNRATRPVAPGERFAATHQESHAHH